MVESKQSFNPKKNAEIFKKTMH